MPRKKKGGPKWGRLLHECARWLGVDGRDVDLDFVAVLASAALDVPAPSCQKEKWRVLAKYRAHKCGEDRLEAIRAADNVVELNVVKPEEVPTGEIDVEAVRLTADNWPPKTRDLREIGDELRAKQEKDDFYRSPGWRKLRYQVLQAHGNCCQCCGASPRKGFPLHVDHIKPRSRYPELALDFDNLQVLCPDCNLGKSAWDETDWRE